MKIATRLKRWIDCFNCDACLERIEQDIIKRAKEHNGDVISRGKSYNQVILKPSHKD